MLPAPTNGHLLSCLSCTGPQLPSFVTRVREPCIVIYQLVSGKNKLVKRPGESDEGVGRKKIVSCYPVVCLFFFYDGTEAAIAINPIEVWGFCVLFLLCCFAFVSCFVWFVCDFIAMGPPNGLCTGRQSLFSVAYLNGHAYNLPIKFPASTNLLNDLAKAMKALDGKKSSSVQKHPKCEI